MTKNWAEKKSCILGYYQKDGLPLMKVMEIMREKHSFNASQRAYRQQFQKWAVFKYNRKSRGNHTSSDHRHRHHHNYHGHHGHHGYHGHYDHHGYHGHSSMSPKNLYDDAYPRNTYHDKGASLPQLQPQLPKPELSPSYPYTPYLPYAHTHARSTATPESSPEASDTYSKKYKAYPENEALPYRFHNPLILPAPPPQYNHQSYYMDQAAPEPTTGGHPAESEGQYQSCCQQGRCSHYQSSVSHGSHPQSVQTSSTSPSSYDPSIAHSSFSVPSSRSSQSPQSPHSPHSPHSSHSSHSSHSPHSPHSSHSSHVVHSSDSHQSVQSHYAGTLPSLSHPTY